MLRGSLNSSGYLCTYVRNEDSVMLQVTCDSCICNIYITDPCLICSFFSELSTFSSFCFCFCDANFFILHSLPCLLYVQKSHHQCVSYSMLHHVSHRCNSLLCYYNGKAYIKPNHVITLFFSLLTSLSSEPQEQYVNFFF